MSRLRRIADRLPPGWQPGLRAVHIGLSGIAARLRAPWYRYRNVGAQTVIDRSVHVLGWRSVRIGRRSIIGGGSVLNVNNGGGRLRIDIGDHVYVGRFGFFSNGALIRIGDYGLIGPGCRFLGADHVFADPFRPYIATGVTDTGELVLGVNCWLGAGVTVLGGVTIGHGSVVGANALVTRDLPPFSVAMGSPARVVQRYDMARGTWIPAQDFTPELAALLPDEDAYRATLQRAAPTIPMPFAAAGPSRGDRA